MNKSKPLSAEVDKEKNQQEITKQKKQDKEAQDKKADEASQESFPASDPPAWTQGTKD